MAGAVDSPQFSLPFRSLSEADRLVGHGYDFPSGPEAGGFVFPPEFPYPVDSWGPTPTLNSPDERDVVAELTRLLARSTLRETQRRAAFEGSPVSTPSPFWNSSHSNGSSEKSSSPTTPLGGYRDPCDVLRAAAGQMERLKMDSVGSAVYSHQYRRNGMRFPSSGDVTLFPARKSEHCNQLLPGDVSRPNMFLNRWPDQVPNCSMSEWLSQYSQAAKREIQRRNMSSLGSVHEICGCPRHQQNLSGSGPGMRATAFGGGEYNGKTRESTGTGVFFPRRYRTAAESRKKPGCSSVLLPARMAQALNMNAGGVNDTAPPRFGVDSYSDYDSLAARHTHLAEQRNRSRLQDGVKNSEIVLPQEWTY